MWIAVVKSAANFYGLQEFGTINSFEIAAMVLKASYAASNDIKAGLIKPPERNNNIVPRIAALIVIPRFAAARVLPWIAKVEVLHRFKMVVQIAAVECLQY